MNSDEGMKAQAPGGLIAPLTGLRFVAAATVAIGHAAPSLRSDWLGQLVAQISSIGMTLFFVLSGFVLWFTYAEKLRKNPRIALREFAIARFARLYPMYAVTVFLISGYLAIWRNQDLASLGFVLTMTQSWFPAIKGTMLVASIQSLEHLWSISVELFFYVLFPLVCLFFGRMYSRRAMALAAFANIVIFAVLIVLFFLSGEDFVRAVVPSLTQGGLAWLTYYSPYLHISQFLAGCLIAQIYLGLRAVEIDESGRSLVKIALWLSFAALLAAPALLFFQPRWPAMSLWIEVGVRLIEVASFSVIILEAAGFKSLDLLGSKALVAGGECSYSFYLLHPFLFRFALVGRSEQVGLPEFCARLLFFVILTTAVAWLCYKFIEVPSKTWIRHVLRNGRSRGALPTRTTP
jgi:peptidoglycan/LPS O-acetylase OafA/YrhL